MSNHSSPDPVRMTPSRYSINAYRDHVEQSPIQPAWLDEARAFHARIPGLNPTPLFSLPSLARELGLGSILLKDESNRLGLKSFKVLGAAFGIFKWLEARQERAGSQTSTQHLCTATDGNHGRAVAWAAKRLGLRATIFVPSQMVPARILAIESEGAEVVRVEGTYDDAVAAAAEAGSQSAWQVISDTSYEGYGEIPSWIMAGYTTLFREAEQQIEDHGYPKPDLIFLQAGVGGFACAGITHFNLRSAAPPTFIVVEPLQADALLSSIESPNGSISSSSGTIDSMMSGLNCAQPSTVCWPYLRSHVDLFLAVDDEWAARAMQSLHRSRGDDPQVTSGESGAAGLAGLLAVLHDPELKDVRGHLALGPGKTVLLINTEGATDPANFAAIVGA